jgi:hypothetical protein
VVGLNAVGMFAAVVAVGVKAIDVVVEAAAVVVVACAS